MKLPRLAFIECKRKSGKNIILLAALTVTFTAIFLSMRIYLSASSAAMEIYDSIGSYIELSESDYAYEEGLDAILSDETIEEIAAIDHVESVNEQLADYVTPVGFNNVKDHTGVTPTEDFDSGTDLSEDAVIIDANLDISCVDIFRLGQAEVIEGEMPSLENPGLLVEKRLAQANGLYLGDSITVKSSYYGAEITARIVGIYETDAYFEITSDNGIGTAVYAMSPYNRIYASMDIGTALFDISPFNRGLQIYVDRQENLNAVAREVKALNLDWSLYDLYNMTQELSVMDAGNVLSLLNYSKLAFFFAAAAGAVILLILLTIFAKYYIYDGALMVALGMEKKRVALYYFLSLLYICAAAFAIAVVLSAALSPSICSGIIGTADVVSSTTTAYLTGLNENYNGYSVSLVSLSPEHYLIFAGIGILFLIFACIWPTVRIAGYQPRKIIEGEN